MLKEKKWQWQMNKELLERTEAINEQQAQGKISEYERALLLDELWAEYYEE